MGNVRLKGITGEFKIYQQNGVFLTLLAITQTSLYMGDGLYYVVELPQKIGFKEWQAMGGSLSSDAKIKYEYGYIKCHKNQLVV